MRTLCAFMLAVVASGVAMIHAAEPPTVAPRVLSDVKPAKGAKAVDLFKAAEAGQIEVRVIPRDEKQARILVTNKTNEPLRVRMPAVYAASPILAQFNGFGNNNQQQTTQSASQRFGGPTNMQQNNNRGLFNIPPQQTRDVKVAGVCLDYGKPLPRAAMPYRLVPLSTVSTRPELETVLREFGEGECSQKVAQAAAWQITGGLTWEQLREEKGAMVAATVFEPYFTKQELDEAQKLVEKAAAEESQPSKATKSKTSKSKAAKSKASEPAKSPGETNNP
ncbi:MAG TPA: hypothetical protein VHV77_14045 [Pirellulales bacterium]|jgi:hypothetical protein|nr:hypothetical protein [Pirellulales bacterium]